MSTQAGAVEGKALTGDQVDVQSQAGAASLEFAEAPLSVKAVTEVGAISVHVPGDRAYAVNAGTKAGATKVSVRKDAASQHHIDVADRRGCDRDRAAAVTTTDRRTPPRRPPRRPYRRLRVVRGRLEPDRVLRRAGLLLRCR